MDKELFWILNFVKERTKIEVDAISLDGVNYATTFKEGKQSEVKSVNSITAMGGFTYFPFTYNKIKYVGAIEGEGEKYSNYASLISALIENYASDKELSYSERLSAILLGETTAVQVERFMEKYNLPSNYCYVALFKGDSENYAEIKDFLNNYSVNGGDSAVITSKGVALVKFIESVIDGEYSSAEEYVNLLVRALYEETGIRVNSYIGGKVKSFLKIASSMEQAEETERLSKLLGEKEAVCDYKDYVLLKIMEDVPRYKLKEHFNVLSDYNALKILKDEELKTTAETFLLNDLNLSETARAMYVHRNTLTYRLDKIQKLTGLDLRKFKNAMIFKLLCAVNGVELKNKQEE